MNFGVIILNESIKSVQNYVKRTQIVSLLILKLKIFIKILLLMMLKNGLIHQHIAKMIVDHFQEI